MAALADPDRRVALAARRGRDDLPRIAIAGNVIAALGLAASAQSRWMPLSAAGMVAIGLGTIAQAASTNWAIQLRMPDDKRGRMLAICTAMSIGATPLGSLFFGRLGQAIGAALTVWRARTRPG